MHIHTHAAVGVCGEGQAATGHEDHSEASGGRDAPVPRAKRRQAPQGENSGVYRPGHPAQQSQQPRRCYQCYAHVQPGRPINHDGPGGRGAGLTRHRHRPAQHSELMPALRCYVRSTAYALIIDTYNSMVQYAI